MKFYKDHYDVIVIGGGLSGLSSALMLADKGKDVLVLERHNLPGGLATSFVRGGVEIEATLHEMMSIGDPGKRLKIGQFLEDMGVNVDWLDVPEAYHLSVPGIEKTMHPGFERFAREADEVCPGTYQKVLDLLNLCHTVYDSVNELSIHPMSKPAMLMKHEAFVKTAGYSAKEVIDTFDLPQKAVDLLAPYWIYVGAPLSILPFTIWAVLMADYVGYGSKVPKKLSHEMSLKMQERAEEMGVQVELKQPVEKILVKDGKAYRIGLTAFTVFLLLDKSAEELGITDYNVFLGETMDTDKIFENYKGTGPYNYLTTICLNHANPTCTPEGTCIISITALPRIEGWQQVGADEIDKVKHETAKSMVDAMSKYYGVDLLAHALEVIIETPMTVAHYTGMWNGCIYGYLHSMDDHIVARLQTAEEEHFIDHLEFAGAHQISGNGMGPAVTNGRKAAKNVLDTMAKEAN